MRNKRAKKSTHMNRFGLSRTIPPEVKLAIRQAAGFGCVICGLGIIEYEHVDPEFKDARSHDPQKMTLLCPGCHAKVTRKFLSKETVKKAMLSPKANEQGFSRDLFDLGNGSPIIKVGGALLSNCRIPLQIGNEFPIRVDPPEEPGAPFRLSAFFTDKSGKITVRIVENEWFALTSNWDVEATAGSLIVREGSDAIHLQLDSQPPDTLIVSKLEMSFGGFRIEASEAVLRITGPDNSTMELTDAILDENRVGLALG